MKSYATLKLQETKYLKKFVCAILEHIDDDDYFYNKRNNFEEWICMREDVKEALNKLNIKHIKTSDIKRLLFLLNKEINNV